MPWTESEYRQQSRDVEARYRNMWGVWGDWADAVGYGWALYAGLLPPSQQDSSGGVWLDFQLLGDTKIRKDPSLLANFGNTESSGLQGKDEEDAVLAAALSLVTQKNDAQKVQSVGVAPLQSAHREGMKRGVILSEKTWSTLSNDSFMLAGIHQQKDFHFVGEIPVDPAKPAIETSFAEFRTGQGMHTSTRLKKEIFEIWAAGVGGRRIALEDAKAEVAKRGWLAFFRNYPHVTWNEAFGIPRVFARELHGLRAFGYEPHFHEDGLFFTCRDPAAASRATFDAYMTALERARFGDKPSPKDAILRPVYEFLFGTGVSF